MGEDEQKRRPMTVQEAGRRGGTATSRRYGREHYKVCGKKGGQTVARKYGHEHFVHIGEMGGRSVQELIRAGRAALAEGS